MSDPKEIDATLIERGGRYGDFKDNATVVQGMMEALKKAPNFDQLPTMHVEAYRMIFYKISRSACGDPMYFDNVHDIIGYARLLEKYIAETNFGVHDK